MDYIFLMILLRAGIRFFAGDTKEDTKLKNMPNTVISLFDCSIPDNKPLQPVFNEFQIESEEGMLFEEQHEDTVIFLSYCFAIILEID